jgi:hypothetical protein
LREEERVWPARIRLTPAVLAGQKLLVGPGAPGHFFAGLIAQKTPCFHRFLPAKKDRINSGSTQEWLRTGLQTTPHVGCFFRASAILAGKHRSSFAFFAPYRG